MNLAQRIVEALQRGGYLLPEVAKHELAFVTEVVEDIIAEEEARKLSQVPVK